MGLLQAWLAAALVLGAQAVAASACDGPAIPYTVVAEHPHDVTAFTQGLTFTPEGELVEGTGLYGRSRLTIGPFPPGPPRLRRDLPDNLFGEGVTLLDGRVFQLTWQAGRALVYELPDLVARAAHDYPGQGWGLTHDGSRLIMSDGGAHLVFRDPASFSPLTRLGVRVGQRPLERLNELEYVAGVVYANIWPTDCVAAIDVTDGRVTGWLDLAPLRERMPPLHVDAVANGIAFHASSGHLVVTGKLWPKLFELRLE